MEQSSKKMLCSSWFKSHSASPHRKYAPLLVYLSKRFEGVWKHIRRQLHIFGCVPIGIFPAKMIVITRINSINTTKLRLQRKRNLFQKMDFTRKIRIKSEKVSEVKSLETLYPHNVMLYTTPPTHDITTDQFQSLVTERLAVLRILEQASAKQLRYLSDEWKEDVRAELANQKLKGYQRLLQSGSSKNTEADVQARQDDYVSHFLMRLAYCRSQDLRKWFVTKELDLFRLKFSSLTTAEIREFLSINQLDYTPLTVEQKDDIKDGLYESTIGVSNTKIEILDFYKVDFLEVLDMVHNRRCYIKDGFAYITTSDFVSIVATKLQKMIEIGLQHAIQLLSVVETDERLASVIKGLHTSYTGKDYALKNANTVPIESLDNLSKKSFALCMRNCHDHLRQVHHLKHHGRQQYGLFLKGIGVTMDDSLKFWMNEFTKTMDVDKFNKEYRYNIRHSYGQEGSMTNYSSYSCIKILNMSTGAGEIHGCPYKVWDSLTLRTKLAAYGIGSAHVDEIVSFAAKDNYQQACHKYFEAVHDTPLIGLINHPNQYFDHSQNIIGNRTVTAPVAKVATGTTGQRTQKRPVEDVVVKRNKAAMMSENYDEELWQCVDKAESQVYEESVQMEWNEDLDISQVDVDF